MRILLAVVTNSPHEILESHFKSVKSLDLPPKVRLDLAYISDGLAPESLRMLHEGGASVADALPKTPDVSYAVTEQTHEWGLPTFAWLAREKQRLLEHAKEGRYDAVFFVDSDLILGPETLASLIASEKDVVSAVFWTRWQPKAPPLPQVWMTHPYDFNGRGISGEEFLSRLDAKALMRVGGLGACTLMRARVFDKVEWFPLLEGLPQGGMWQGEDRSFCIKAERAHVELWADAWPDIFHQYRPSEIARLGEWRTRLPKRPETPSVGSWVSLILEPLEERELHSHRESVRGRLGALPVLPQIEAEIFKMRRGETRVVKVEFPAWWSLKEYAGREKSVLVRLVDAKDYYGL